jgi:tetratricopeptide (TPR) repeat protein
MKDAAFKSDVLSMLQSFAQFEKDKEAQLAVMEQMLELRPEDIRIRFSLAYEYSQSGIPDMALYHYIKIPTLQRTSITWNNLGVSFDNIEMPVRAINAWRKSAQENDTLAMSNLGFRMLGAGFFEEAKKECEKALALGNYHKNVPELLKRLNEVEEEENRKLDEALDKVKAKASFYRKLGEAILRPSPTDIAKDWNAPSGAPLQARIEGDTVRIEGTHERSSNPFGGLLASSAPLGLGARNVIHRTTYVGRLRGSTILGDVKRSRDGEVPSLLAEGLSNPTVLMYFNAAHTELHAMENPHNESPTFYSLRKAELSSERAG